MRPLAPVEAALAFCLTGSLLALTIPAFLRNLHASKMSEALVGLERISARAASLADVATQTRAYPESAPLTPANVPRGVLVAHPKGTWDLPTWRLLAFSIDVPHAYSFRFDSENGPAVSRFTATAHGDLDGDGVLSTFQVSGSVRPGQPPERGVLEVSREVE